MTQKTLGRQAESLTDNMFEKLKVDGIKKEIISELQESIEKLFRTSCRYLKLNVKN